MDISRFKELPLMGILRGGDVEVVEPLVECVAAAGLQTFEITLNTPDAFAMIRRLREVAGDRLMIGAGTVTRPEQVETALAAGATFIVSPVLVPGVAAACREADIPAFPGAFSPREIFEGWQSGAAMIKLFPAKAVGPGYIKEIKGPFADIEILACGGVTPGNMETFFANGASAVAFGGSVFGAERLAARDFAAVQSDVEALVSAYASLAL